MADQTRSLLEVSYEVSMELFDISLTGGNFTDSSSAHSSSGHGSSHSGGHQLFGSLELLEVDKWSVSLVIVVCSVLLIEGIFHLVHILTEDTPFHKVIVALEKELMIVGVTAFMFKIILNSISSLDVMWKFALEIADLIVPLFSFTNCFISLILIFRSLHHCDIWSKASHLKAAELLDEYVSSSLYLRLRRIFPAFSKLIEEIEFQFLHDIFCSQYSVKKQAFAFDEYASLVYERFIQHIIELRLYHWAVFVAFLMLYWIPNRTVQEVYSCHDSTNEHYCLHHGATVLLIIFGGGLLCFTICFAVASRYYIRAILQQNGLNCIDDYPNYLQQMDSSEDYAVEEKKRLGEEELKIVIQAALKDAAVHHPHGRGHGHNRIIKEFFLWIESFRDRAKFCFHSSGPTSVVPLDESYNEEEMRDMINSSFKQVMLSVKKSADAAAAGALKAAEQASELGFNDQNSHGGESTQFKQKHHHFRHGHLRHLTDIFLFRKPSLYFEGVQMLLLPISLYFAVWMVEFSVYREEAYLKLISLLFGVASVLCYMHVVKSAALLKAIYHVDNDAMLEVIEQTEGSRLLGETIREKLLHRLSRVEGDAYSILRSLFDEIDKNRSNKLSRVEFEILMDRLEVNFSRKKWKQIYHEIDRNYDDEISFDEFFIFLFPSHDFAQANEIKRLKIVRSRVLQRQHALMKAPLIGKGKRSNLIFDDILQKESSEGRLSAVRRDQSLSSAEKDKDIELQDST